MHENWVEELLSGVQADSAENALAKFERLAQTSPTQDPGPHG